MHTLQYVPAQLERGELATLATLGGKTKAHIHYVLKGERKPSAELAQVIVAYLGHRTPHAARQHIAAALGRTEADLWPVAVPVGPAAEYHGAEVERVAVPGVDCAPIEFAEEA